MRLKKRKPGLGASVAVMLLILALCAGIGLFPFPGRDGPDGRKTRDGEFLPGTALLVSPEDVFPGGSGKLRRKEERAAVRSFLRLAGKTGAGTILWPVRDPGRTALRRTRLLARRSGEAGFSFYALLPPLDAGSEGPVRELAAVLEKKSAPSGFLLTGTGGDGFLPRAVADFTAAAGRPVRFLGTGLSLGTLRSIGRIPGLEALYCALPDAETDEALRDGWAALAEEPVPVLPFVPAGNGLRRSEYQLFLSSGAAPVPGVAVEGFPGTREGLLRIQRLFSFAGADSKRPGEDVVDLSIGEAEGPAVGYPRDGAVLPHATTVIMGTSDPGRPLTLDGKEVERPGASGCFMLEAPLRYGTNVFTFRQGADEARIRIRRPSPAGAGRIRSVSESGRFPAGDAAFRPGDRIGLTCVAPSGGAVTATVGGTAVRMVQKAAAEKGVAAVFGGEYTVPDRFPAGELTRIGTVVYTLRYEGKIRSYASAGALYAAGKDVTPTIRATAENVSLLETGGDPSSILGTFHRGARIPVLGAVQRGGALFYRVDGGYVASDRAELEKGVFPGESVVTRLDSREDGRRTVISFRTDNFPAATGGRDGDLLTVTLYRTSLPEDLGALRMPEIGRVERRALPYGTELRLTLSGDRPLWGYDLQYAEDGSLLLTLQRPPERSERPGKPLSGVSVTVDPGHGSADTGAFGPTGPGGPTEADLNLAVGLLLRERLEQLGASVTMTRGAGAPDAPKVTLDERVRRTVETRPDFFLSVHHNSTPLIREVTAGHAEVYYFDPAALPFAGAVRDNLGRATGRPVREPEWGYYYVTRVSACPALLCEIGFLPNPVQYEDCARWTTVYRTAAALAGAILDSVPEPPDPGAES